MYVTCKESQDKFDIVLTNIQLFTIVFPLAQIEQGNAGIVVANLARLVLPGVDVHVLILDTLAQLLADEHVVKSLAVAVKQVCVSLCHGDLGSIVNVNETRGLDESLDRCNIGELVEVASHDNVSLTVLLEDLSDEVLEVVSLTLSGKKG